MPALSHALALDNANYIFRGTSRSTKNSRESVAAHRRRSVRLRASTEGAKASL